MPIYSYACEQCGSFELIRPMAQYRQAARCPTCGQTSGKVLTGTHFNIMPTAKREAHRINETSAHAPRVTSRSKGSTHKHDILHRQPGGQHEHRHASHSRPWQLGH